MLTVQNATRDAVVVNKGRVAKNIWTRLKGLIGVRELPPGDGLLITPCKGIHCMFMSIPIDVLYVDKAHRVIAIDRNVKPWHVSQIYSKSSYVIELPTGTVARTETNVGDQLRVNY